MIILDNSLIIGKGTNRTCYLYPNNSKCIKINNSSDNSETKKEIMYYKYLIKENISFTNLSKYYGVVETNLGKGYVFDLIKDYDGEISKTLSYYLQTEDRTKSILNPLKLLEDLKRYTLHQGIIVKDLNTKNIMYQKIDENIGRLIIIDGITNSNFFSISRYFKKYRLKKINYFWEIFEESLPIKYCFNNYFIELYQ